MKTDAWLWRIFVICLCCLAAALHLQAQTAPSIAPGGIVNAASFGPAPLAPGSIATAFGNFSSAAPVSAGVVPLPTNLSGLSLQFASGQQAPLFYAAPGQVNFQVPWELAGSSQTTLMPILNSQAGSSQTLTLAPYAPGIFSVDMQGNSQGLIVDTSYNLVNASNPATPGVTVVLIYATGLGAVNNPPATGSPALGSPLSRTVATPTVTIGGAQASVLFSGLAPQEIGVYQINALVPAGAAGGWLCRFRFPLEESAPIRSRWR